MGNRANFDTFQILPGHRKRRAFIATTLYIDRKWRLLHYILNIIFSRKRVFGNTRWRCRTTQRAKNRSNRSNHAVRISNVPDLVDNIVKSRESENRWAVEYLANNPETRQYLNIQPWFETKIRLKTTKPGNIPYLLRLFEQQNVTIRGNYCIIIAMAQSSMVNLYQ